MQYPPKWMSHYYPNPDYSPASPPKWMSHYYPNLDHNLAPPPYRTVDLNKSYLNLPPMNAQVPTTPVRVPYQQIPPIRVPLNPNAFVPNPHYGNYQHYNPNQYHDPYRSYDAYQQYGPNRPSREPIPPSPEPPDSEEEAALLKQWCYEAPEPCHEAPRHQIPRKPPALPRKGYSTRRRDSLRTCGANLPFDALNLAPRPVYWRPDYKAPHSSPSKSQRPFFKKKWPGGTLHDLIRYHSSSKHPVSYDLRLDPTTTDIQYLNIPRYGNDIDWYQVATNPPVYELSLYHRKLPWTITIQATQSNGITIGDIFEQIYQNLRCRAHREDYYNAALNSSDREEVMTAFGYRQGFETSQEGLQRMDFLGFDVVFLGLASGKNGFLEIMTSKALLP